MHRIADLLKIRPGEGRMAALVIGVMLFTMAGSGLGGTGIEALFFSRFGVEFLPYMYMALGFVSFVTSLAITALLGRLPREALYVTLPLVLALILVGARVALTLHLNWFYPAMWLGKEVMNSLIALFSWGLAGAICDTRQAKRLFPLFGAGRILGSVLGGLGTGVLVNWLGTENLLLAWAVTMALAFVLARALLSLNRNRVSVSPPVSPRRPRQRQPSLITEMQRGYQFVRRSSLMRWVSAAAVLFSVLYFSLALPFSKAATAQFPDEDALAGFLGLFNGLSTAAAFLASLFLANRLYARFGIMRAILAFPVIYLVGFATLAAYAAFPVIVVFRFIQMLWLSGIADSAYQAMFNAVPLERRDQVRAFIGGVPEQAGTLIAGAVLVIGEQALPSQQLYFIGLAAAALTTLIIWRATRAYARALVDALRAGRPQLFFSEEEPFGGFQRDASAIRVAVDGMGNADPVIRRISAEILGNLPAPQAMNALVNALQDPDAQVRAAGLKALARAKATPALLEVSACLRDPEPEVRAQAVEALRQLAGYPGGLTAYVRPLLGDPDSFVRARAAVAILCLVPDPQARDMLREMAVIGETDQRVNALTALGEWGDAEAFALIETELDDRHAPAAVRRAAATALVRCGPDALNPLVAALSAEDRSVRETVAAALGRLGPPALERTAAALFVPASETGALLALERLPAHQAAEPLRRYARERVASAQHYGGLWRKAEPHDHEERVHLLVESLRDEARRHGLNALRAMSLLGERDSLTVALDNLQSADPNQRANALETLEAAREAALIRPLLKLWEPGAAQAVPTDGVLTDHLLEVLREPVAWLRACAVLAASVAPLPPNLRAALTELARSDPDPTVRDTAAHVTGGQPMDTLQTLSLMERILFLRRVPLFAELSTADLKQVANIASEQQFPDGEAIFLQGEPGEEMYIIVSGEVRVLVSKEGKAESEVARRKTGEVVGEMAVISREPRMASLVAAGEVRTLCIDRKSFEGLLSERPETSLHVMRVLCQRLKEATR
jgi:HEAT repeat protein